MVEDQNLACPMCDAPTSPLIIHVLSQHHNDLGILCISEYPLSTDKLLTLLVDCDIPFAHKLWSFFTVCSLYCFIILHLHCVLVCVP